MLGNVNQGVALSISRKSKAGVNILVRKVGKFRYNIIGGHAGGEIFQHIKDRDAQTSNRACRYVYRVRW